MAEGNHCKNVRYVVTRQGMPPHALTAKEHPLSVAAMLVVAHGNVPLFALNRQVEALQGKGMLVRVLPPKPCRSERDLQDIGKACDSVLESWDDHSSHFTRAIFVWCPLASMLRRLPLHVGLAGPIVLRAFGPPKNQRAGCSEHPPQKRKMLGNGNDGDLIGGGVRKRRRTSLTSPSREAWLLAQSIEPAHRNFTLIYETFFNPVPLTSVELPLVNCQLLSETGDNSRNQ